MNLLLKTFRMRPLQWITAIVLVSLREIEFRYATAISAPKPSTSSFDLDPSYVVQIHSNRDGFVPPADTKLRTQVMTTEAGQRFECFLPLTPEEKARSQEDFSAPRPAIEGDDQMQAFMDFARAASTKTRPKCLQYVDVVDKWMYEICPGMLVRKVNLVAQSVSLTTSATEKKKGRLTHDIRELAEFATEKAEQKISFTNFISSSAEKYISKTQNQLYTQVFHARNPIMNSIQQEEQEQNIEVQFLCNSKRRDDSVAAVKWREYELTTPDTQTVVKRKEAVGFLIFSRAFCDPKYSEFTDQNEVLPVNSLLRPLVDSKTCIKRNEGWWTYEFCFGHSIRQYHREADGQVSVEYSLGSYDDEENQKLEADGTALVLEHIDATHDVSRPAFKEIYSSGTPCSDVDGSLLRQAKVFYYCSQVGMNHHILSVKETQTCSYTIKISSPAVCDHPHFAEEQKGEQLPETVHCVPIQENGKVAMDMASSTSKMKEMVITAT